MTILYLLLTLLVLAAFIALDPYALLWVHIIAQLAWVESARLLFKLKMEWDLFMIKFSGRKYRRMAKQILKELETK